MQDYFAIEIQLLKKEEEKKTEETLFQALLCCLEQLLFHPSLVNFESICISNIW